MLSSYFFNQTQKKKISKGPHYMIFFLQKKYHFGPRPAHCKSNMSSHYHIMDLTTT